MPIVGVLGFHKALIQVQTGDDPQNKVKEELADSECNGNFLYPFCYCWSSTAGKEKGYPEKFTSKYMSRLINKLFFLYAF